jgi:AcrR family transcriptional regulator
MTVSERVPSSAAAPVPEIPRSNGGYVGDIQRARILAAMVEVVAEQGFAGAAVAPVLAHAGVSRRTFYEFFESREDCFLAALDEAIEQVTTHALSDARQRGSWQARIRRALTRALSFFEEHPSTGRLLVVEALAAGPKARERRAEVLAALAAAIDEGRTVNPGQELTPITAEAVVGAVLSVIQARLLDRQPQPLVELVSPLMGMIVLPYLGRAGARRELQQPTVAQPPVRSAPVDPLRDLGMRLTYRTVRVLQALRTRSGSSNRQVSQAAGIADAGQISKLLRRLAGLGLVENLAGAQGRRSPNAWALTDEGLRLERALSVQPEQGAMA